MSGVVGIVLAAGAGRRFGSAKALAVLDGQRLVDRAVATLRAGGCEHRRGADLGPFLRCECSLIGHTEFFL